MDSVKDAVVKFLSEVADEMNKDPEPDWEQIWYKQNTEDRVWVFASGSTAKVGLFMEAIWSPSENVGKIRAKIFPHINIFLWNLPPKEWKLLEEVMICDHYPEVIEVAQAKWQEVYDKFLSMTVPVNSEKAPESQI